MGRKPNDSLTRPVADRFAMQEGVAIRNGSGASSEQQILADYTSMQTKIPVEFWTELKAQNLIEQNASVLA